MWVGLLPGALVLGLLVPSVKGLPVGVGEALGCSGGPNLPPQQWATLGPMWLSSTTGAVPVATDGFFAILAAGNGLSLELAQAELRVVVTDSAGTEVPGDVSVLQGDSNDSHLLGWVAREPLAVGARLTATLSTEPPTDAPVGGQYVLDVEGAPVTPPTPQTAFSRWGTIYGGDGTGEFVSCQATNGCGPAETLSVPARISEQVAAFPAWIAPEIVGSVAWRIRAEPVSPEGTAVGESRSFFGDVEQYREHFETATGGVPLFELNRIDFRVPAARYCVNVIVEDLRTGIEQRSELCSAPGALERFGSATGLERCNEPPSAELTALWCELKPNALELPTCEAYRAPRPLPADAGSASEDGAADPGASGEPPAVVPAGKGTDRTLVGCAMGTTGSAPHAVVACAAVAFTSLARRWGRRRPTRTP